MPIPLTCREWRPERPPQTSCSALRFVREEVRARGRQRERTFFIGVLPHIPRLEGGRACPRVKFTGCNCSTEQKRKAVRDTGQTMNAMCAGLQGTGSS